MRPQKNNRDVNYQGYRACVSLPLELPLIDICTVFLPFLTYSAFIDRVSNAHYTMAAIVEAHLGIFVAPYLFSELSDFTDFFNDEFYFFCLIIRIHIL